MNVYRKIDIIWHIIGVEHYGFGSDNCLYNLKTSRQKKQCYKDGSIGYWIGKDFYSLKKLKKLLFKPKKSYCPF